MGHWISIAARPQHIITKLKNNCCKQAISPTITQKHYSWRNYDITTIDLSKAEVQGSN
jgi:hypothetical protein